MIKSNKSQHRSTSIITAFGKVEFDKKGYAEIQDGETEEKLVKKYNFLSLVVEEGENSSEDSGRQESESEDTGVELDKDELNELTVKDLLDQFQDHPSFNEGELEKMAKKKSVLVNFIHKRLSNKQS